MLSKKALMSTAAAAEALAIEDVFSTYLYTGNGSTQTITNGIDLAGEGGLVWRKQRTAISWTAYTHHSFSDTERGVNRGIMSGVTSAEQISSDSFVTAFNSDGFSIGSDSSGFGTNKSTETYASWTFRKAERFFDVVTYTGTGSNRTIAHNLGVVPGCIIVKRRDATGAWQVYHRSNANTEYMVLNTTAAKATGATRWNSTTPTSAVFSLGTDTTVNASGGTYVAYLFAHDPLGPSGDGSDGLIACGSYTGNGSTTGPVIDLGWEPQWVMIKNVSAAGWGWYMFDTMRGFSWTQDSLLAANEASGEASSPPQRMKPLATGFQPLTSSSGFNGSGENYIYIAIRRGPMREPTSGTEVFSAVTSSAASGTKLTTSFPVDMQITAYRSGTAGKQVVDRMRGVSTNTTGSGQTLYTNTTAAEAADAGSSLYWDNTGFQMPANWASISDVFYNFRRAPGFFDVVAYKGGASSSVFVQNHNLGVVPELMIVKRRDVTTANWIVWAGDITKSLILNSTNSVDSASGAAYWNSTNPTATQFSVGGNAAVNNSSSNYIAYLFASLPGISKVGSYTGNGSNQTINCGFTTGARFILIKRTDSTGDWYVWDTARGIVTGNDPHLSLNTTAAEVTTNDTIDPDSTGFIVNQVAATNVNVNTATYIYLAIA